MSGKKRFWDYDKCYEEALKYTNYSDFWKYSSSAYNASCKRGWLNDFFWLQRKCKTNKYWNYEHCYEEAKKYNSKKLFCNGNKSAYCAALKNNWINDYTWFKNTKEIQKELSTKFTYDVCYNIAKKYDNKVDLKKYASGVYNAAYRNKWIKDYYWFKKMNQSLWDKLACYNEAKKYNTLYDFRKNSPAAYCRALRKKWDIDYIWLKRVYVKPGHWDNYETCYTEALKYTSLKEFRHKSKGCYSVAYENDWLKNFTWLQDNRIDFYGNIDCVYAYEFIEHKAVYIGRTLMKRCTKRDLEHLYRDNDSVYKFAKENNIPVPKMKILEDNLTLKQGSEKEGIWVEEYKNNGWKILNKIKTGALGNLDNGKWNYKRCYNEAKKYTTTKQYMKNSPLSYHAAVCKGWLKDYDWLVKERVKSVKKWTYELCYTEAKKYSLYKDFRIGNKTAYSRSRSNGWIKNFTWLKEKK